MDGFLHICKLKNLIKLHIQVHEGTIVFLNDFFTELKKLKCLRLYYDGRESILKNVNLEFYKLINLKKILLNNFKKSIILNDLGMLPQLELCEFISCDLKSNDIINFIKKCKNLKTFYIQDNNFDEKYNIDEWQNLIKEKNLICYFNKLS